MQTGQQLASLARKVLRGDKFIVVSNREPFSHVREGDQVSCMRPAGGLTAALEPIVSATEGTWVAVASGNADRETADEHGRLRVPPEKPSWNLRRVWLPEQMQREYYEGLANEALWPLCHNVYRRPVFRQSNWTAYRRANEAIAEAVLDEAGGGRAVVFIQDYHLALLPALLKARNPYLTVAQFWHIPWPDAQTMQVFPWLDELVHGLLGNDLLSFHLDGHCRNFLATAAIVNGTRVDNSASTVWGRDRATVLQSAPISIDFEQHSARASSDGDVATHAEEWRARIGPSKNLIIGIDRIDYTKGIPERLRAFDLVLDRHPALRGKLAFVQVAVPSRTTVPEYQRLEAELDAAAAAINAKWGREDFQPVILEKRNLPCVEMMALHQLADVCLVTPLHDGMNLVAKEFVASRTDGDGVLVLSRFAGAAAELTQALQVNPFCDEEIAQAIVRGLQMPRLERYRRMKLLRSRVQTSNVYAWAGSLIEAMDRVRPGSKKGGRVAGISSGREEKVA